MPTIDIALAVERILPAAEYYGSTTANTPESWAAVDWRDTRRAKPTWEEVEAAALPSLEEARAAKIAEIDAETSSAILAGFDYAIDGQGLHFSYDTNDQQNFADTANAATLAVMGVPGIPDHVTWNGWIPQPDGSRVLHRLTLTPSAFLALYMEGALTHKGIQMEIGGRRKEAAMEAQSIEELEDI